MSIRRGVSRTLAVAALLALAFALSPPAVSVSNERFLPQKSDPCTSADLAFGYGFFTLCTSKSTYRFSEAVDVTISLTASQDIAFKSATVDIIYNGNTVFSNKQLCLIPEGCLVKAGQAVLAIFFWTAASPAGSYTTRVTVVWDFACTIQQPPCLPIVVPPPSVAELSIGVRAAKAQATSPPFLVPKYRLGILLLFRLGRWESIRAS